MTKTATAVAVAVVVMCVVMDGAVAGRDFYKVLGVPRDASPRTIKKGYRQMARIHHPDQSKLEASEAEAKFREIGRAYEVLSDPDLRAVYDAHGEEGLERHENGGGGGGGGGFGQGGGFKFDFGGGGGGFNPFGSMFGGGGQRKAEVEVELSLSEIFSGGTKKVYVDVGDGRSQRVVMLDIPQGIRAGEKIESPDGKIDFVVKEKAHPRFSRSGPHLHTSVTITLHEALTGASLSFRNIDGERITFEVAPGKIVTPTSKKTFKGKGFVIPSSRSARRGNLVVTFDIVFPDPASVTDADRALLKSSLGHWQYAE